MPVLLVASQFASQKIISPPPSDDPQQQQSQAILKFLPLMIGNQPKRPSLSACPHCLLDIQDPSILTSAGYFSLNVPSGLTLYWLTNNIVTTAQQLYLRSKFQPTAEAATASAPASSAVAPRQQEPEERKLSGLCCHHVAEMVSGADREGRCHQQSTLLM
jgi:YidC/Oxa1 family membrane protein insertase